MVSIVLILQPKYGEIRIAKRLGITYDYLVFDTTNIAQNMKKGITSNIEIDIDAVIKKVLYLLN